MRSIKQTAAFKRDLKREAKGINRQAITEELFPIACLLAADKPLPAKYQDHALTGKWKGYGECHIRPDLLLVYAKIGKDILHLTRLGSHSEIFGG